MGADLGRVQLRSVESHWGPRFSMQVCQQEGRWFMNVEAAADMMRRNTGVVVV